MQQLLLPLRPKTRSKLHLPPLKHAHEQHNRKHERL
jgi:hypothetical protein